MVALQTLNREHLDFFHLFRIDNYKTIVTPVLNLTFNDEWIVRRTEPEGSGGIEWYT